MPKIADSDTDPDSDWGEEVLSPSSSSFLRPTRGGSLIAVSKSHIPVSVSHDENMPLLSGRFSSSQTQFLVSPYSVERPVMEAPWKSSLSVGRVDADGAVDKSMNIGTREQRGYKETSDDAKSDIVHKLETMPAPIKEGAKIGVAENKEVKRTDDKPSMKDGK